MHNKRLSELFEKARFIASQLHGQATPEEDAKLADWINADPTHEQIYRELADDISRGKALSELNGFDKKRAYERFLQKTALRKRSFRKHYWISAAAILLIGLSFSFYLIFITDDGKQVSLADNRHDIAPGENKATLILSTGERIDLSSAHKGIVVDDQKLTYDDGTSIDTPVQTDQKKSPVRHYTLYTPRGGKYQIILPDGTKVWLNSASSLTYPGKFAGNSRQVEITGEAYFEVFSDFENPFVVSSSGQRIEVTGTAFNINTYPEEQVIRTTLVNGSVNVITTDNTVQQTVKLLPGEESVLEPGRLWKGQANIQAAIAWKSDRFYFNNTPLEVMMRQLSRWYDIEIVYDQEIPLEYFTGKMSQKLHLMEVLDFLEGSGISFSLVDRTLTINRNQK